MTTHSVLMTAKKKDKSIEGRSSRALTRAFTTDSGFLQRRMDSDCRPMTTNLSQDDSMIGVGLNPSEMSVDESCRRRNSLQIPSSAEASRRNITTSVLRPLEKLSVQLSRESSIFETEEENSVIRKPRDISLMSNKASSINDSIRRVYSRRNSRYAPGSRTPACCRTPPHLFNKADLSSSDADSDCSGSEGGRGAHPIKKTASVASSIGGMQAMRRASFAAGNGELPPKDMKRSSANKEDVFSRDFSNIKIIGKGNFSKVFRGTHNLDNRNYAVKQVKPITHEAQLEAQSMAKLDDFQHIVRYHTSWIQGKTLCIQLELCDYSLRDLIKKKREFAKHASSSSSGPKPSSGFSEQELVEILSAACAGLDCMHSKKIAHSDFKPDNLLRSFSGVWKISDFGLAIDYGELSEENVAAVPMLPSWSSSLNSNAKYEIGADADASNAGGTGAGTAHAVMSMNTDPNRVSNSSTGTGKRKSAPDWDVEEGDCRYLAREIFQGTSRDFARGDMFSVGCTGFEMISGKDLAATGPEWHRLRDADPEYLKESLLESRLSIFVCNCLQPKWEQRPYAGDALRILKAMKIISNPRISSTALLVSTSNHEANNIRIDSARKLTSEASAFKLKAFGQSSISKRKSSCLEKFSENFEGMAMSSRYRAPSRLTCKKSKFKLFSVSHRNEKARSSGSSKWGRLKPSSAAKNSRSSAASAAKSSAGNSAKKRLSTTSNLLDSSPDESALSSPEVPQMKIDSSPSSAVKKSGGSGYRRWKIQQMLRKQVAGDDSEQHSKKKVRLSLSDEEDSRASSSGKEMEISPDSTRHGQSVFLPKNLQTGTGLPGQTGIEPASRRVSENNAGMVSDRLASTPAQPFASTPAPSRMENLKATPIIGSNPFRGGTFRKISLEINGDEANLVSSSGPGTYNGASSARAESTSARRGSEINLLGIPTPVARTSSLLSNQSIQRRNSEVHNPIFDQTPFDHTPLSPRKKKNQERRDSMLDPIPFRKSPHDCNYYDRLEEECSQGI